MVVQQGNVSVSLWRIGELTLKAISKLELAQFRHAERQTHGYPATKSAIVHRVTRV